MSDELFKTAPKAVIEYFDRRPSVPTFDWRDIAAHEHALAHTVAKTAGFDVLEDIRAALRKAVAGRVPFDQFHDELVPLLKAKGWWGEKRRTDPVTRQPVLVQLGSLRRLQIIYWANVHSAHAAGEWTRIQETKTFLPWLTYVSSVSERKRPLHLSWVGTTLPVDDPWWRSHYPPNGWNCKCSVRQVADREAERLHARYGKRTAPPLDERPWLNKRTGETEMIPAGIDPGWQTNSGLLRDRTLGRGLQGALDRMPEPARREAVAQLVQHPIFDHVVQNLGDRARDVIAGTAEGRFAAVAGLIGPARQVALGAKTSIVRLSGETAAHIRADHPEVSVDVMQAIPRMIAAGTAFLDRSSLVMFAELGGVFYRIVIKATRNADEIFITSLHRSNAAQLGKWRNRLDEVN